MMPDDIIEKTTGQLAANCSGICRNLTESRIQEANFGEFRKPCFAQEKQWKQG